MKNRSESAILTLEKLNSIFDYVKYRANALLYIGSLVPSGGADENHPEAFNFFYLLDKLKINSDEKIIIASCFLACLNAAWKAREIEAYIDFSYRLKNEVGVGSFRLLFESKLEKIKLSDYIKICQFLIQLKEEINSEEVLKKYLPDFNQVILELDRIFSEINFKNFQEEKIEEVLTRWGRKGDSVEFPLTEKEVKQLHEDYLNVKKQEQSLKSFTLPQVAEAARTNVILLQKDPHQRIVMCGVIAALRQIIYHLYNLYHYNTQILALLALLRIPDKAKGRIAQIKTGEGKSTIVAMLAVYSALLNQCVDVVTPSHYLAMRDQKKYSPLFTALGMTSSHICYDQPEKQHFNAQILYGTNYDFEFSMLRESIWDAGQRYTTINGILQKRLTDVVIVDEVDNLFLDTALNSARIALSPPIAMNWIYQPLLDFVKKNMGFVKELRFFLSEYLEGKYKEEIKIIDDAQLKKWIQSAETALHYKRDEHYVVKSIHEKNYIVIVDYANTGRLSSEHSRWSHGVHECVELMNGLPPGNESLTVASMSHPAFFNYYKKIYGLTGTIGEDQEREEIKILYQVDTFDVPVHHPSQRCAIPVSLLLSKEQHNQAILENIFAIQKQARPILVLFDTIKKSKQFADFLEEKRLRFQLINEVQAEEEEYLVALAGCPAMITLATNTAGRGTDIILSSKSRKNGGLHVIFTFYPVNKRVEDQGVGRCARQGQPGSSHLILCQEDEKIRPWLIRNNDNERELDQLKKQRCLQIEALSLERIKRSKIDMSQHRILNQFTQLLEFCREELKSLDLKALSELCYAIKKKSTDHKPPCSNPFLFNLCNQAKSLLQQQFNGEKVDWDVFLTMTQKKYFRILLQEWAIFFSRISDECAMLENDEAILFEKFHRFITENLRGCFENPVQGFIDFLKTLLANNSDEVFKIKPVNKEFYSQWENGVRRYFIVQSHSSKNPYILFKEPEVFDEKINTNVQSNKV